MEARVWTASIDRCWRHADPRRQSALHEAWLEDWGVAKLIQRREEKPVLFELAGWISGNLRLQVELVFRWVKKEMVLA